MICISYIIIHFQDILLHRIYPPHSSPAAATAQWTTLYPPRIGIGPSLPIHRHIGHIPIFYIIFYYIDYQLYTQNLLRL